MRKSLEFVPVYQKIGLIPATSADSLVTAGSAHSLRGKALLILNPASLEPHIGELQIDPEILTTITHALRKVTAWRAARVESKKAAASAVHADAAQSCGWDGR